MNMGWERRGKRDQEWGLPIDMCVYVLRHRSGMVAEAAGEFVPEKCPSTDVARDGEGGEQWHEE